MTDMTDAQISKALALAIGYRPEDVKVTFGTVVAVWRTHSPNGFAVDGWYVFSYLDPRVIWPVAERFDCFPVKWAYDNWSASFYAKHRTFTEVADTAAKAVALAVIAEHGG